MGVQICAIPLEGYAELNTSQTLLVVPLPGVCQARVRSHNHKNKFSRTHGGTDCGAQRPVHLHCAMTTPCNALQWGTGKPQPYTMAGPNLLSILLGKRSRGWMHTLAHDSSCAMLKKMQNIHGLRGQAGDPAELVTGETRREFSQVRVRPSSTSAGSSVASTPRRFFTEYILHLIDFVCLEI